MKRWFESLLLEFCCWPFRIGLASKKHEAQICIHCLSINEPVCSFILAVSWKIWSGKVIQTETFQGPLTIIGDLQGHGDSLLTLISLTSQSSNQRFLFLGNYSGLNLPLRINCSSNKAIENTAIKHRCISAMMEFQRLLSSKKFKRSDLFLQRSARYYIRVFS